MGEAPYYFLRNVPLFAELPEAALEALCSQVEEIHLEPGEVLFTEGSLGDKAYIIKDGRLEVYKNADGRLVQLDIRQAGDVIGEIALLESTTRTASVRAIDRSMLYSISGEQFNELIDHSPPIARQLLHTIASRLRSTEIRLRQSEKMAQLGTLVAGIAHELNNPAAAARRGAEQLQESLARLQQAQLQLEALHLDPEGLQSITHLDDLARTAAARPDTLDSITRGDREADIEEWLENHSVDSPWEHAPTLVSLGLTIEELEGQAGQFSAEALSPLIQWLGVTYTVYSLVNEINQGTTRISEIVKALKSYVYLDQAPVQEIDLHEGLDNTLVMLRHKLKPGIEIQRVYETQLPRIQAYGSELNQVWTNIIDNAVDAMGGKGIIKIQTIYRDPWVVVSIEDNGPGIPEEVLPKLFSPFFTTKPVGKGTGLGLNISYNIVHRHGGEIRVTSQPGQTRFVVYLPYDFRAVRDPVPTGDVAEGSQPDAPVG